MIPPIDAAPDTSGDRDEKRLVPRASRPQDVLSSAGGTPAVPTDTIAAISTPPGEGGIGIVRLSGPDASRWPYACSVARTARHLSNRSTRACTMGRSPTPSATVSRWTKSCSP